MADETIAADEATTTTEAETTAATATSATEATSTEQTTATETGTTETTETVVDDWRSRWAGDDEKLLGWLGRFQSEAAALKATKQTRDDISSGKYIKPLGAEPTEEELAQYRGMFGIPEAPDGYLEKLPDGLVVGEDDKPGVDKFVQAMHAQNAPKPVVDAALKVYFDMVEEQTAAAQDAAEQAKHVAIEELRTEWGPDYRRNLNAMTGFLDTLPEPVADVFKNGVMQDGTPIGYHPEVIRWLTSQALDKNPLITVVPGAGSNQGEAIADEIEKIEAEISNRNGPYWKGERDSSGKTKLERRYLQLIEAREKVK